MLTKLPPYISNSQLAVFQLCPRLFQLKYIDQVIEEEDELDKPATFGSIVHEGCALHWNGERGISHVAEEHKRHFNWWTYTSLVAILDKYHERYALDTEKCTLITAEKHMIAAAPAFEFNLLKGIMDALVTVKETGKHFLVEHKTIGSNLGEYQVRLEAKNLDTQTMIYQHIASLMGVEIEGVIFDYIRRPLLRPRAVKGEGRKENKEEFDVRVRGAIDDSYFSRFVVKHKPHLLAEAGKDVLSTIDEILASCARGYFRKSSDHACTKYNRLCSGFGRCFGK